MPQFLMMRLEAPLMSYGGVAVDGLRPSNDFPGRSLVTGLLARALGWSHHSHAPLAQRLQDRLSHASRNEKLVRNGNTPLFDYHIAQLDYNQVAWSTTGVPENRAGGGLVSNPRTLEYRTDLRTTVAAQLDPDDEAPTLADLAHALQFPANVLFIGRKTCLPSEPIFHSIIPAGSALEALSQIPSASVDHEDAVQWDGDHEHPSVATLQTGWLQDTRDWRNEIHTGRRPIATGLMLNPLRPGSTAADEPDTEEAIQ